MKSSITKKPGSQIELDITLDQKEFQTYWQQAFDDAVGKVHLKGFRPGAAPKEMAEQAVNKEEVFNEAARNAVRFSMNEQVQDRGWTVIDTPKIELKEHPTGLHFVATLTLFPEIKLGDYKKIAKKVFAEKKEIPETTDAEVEEALQWLRESRAKLVRAEREARQKDVVEIDVKSVADGKTIDDFKKDQFILGRSMFVPGFDEKIEGRKAGETFEFTLHAPKDFRQQTIQDKDVHYTVTVHAVFDRELPELNDEFAKGLGKFENVAGLREAVKANTKLEKEHKERERLRIKVLDEIIKATTMEVSEIMVEKTLDQMTAQFAAMAQDAEKMKELRSGLRDRALHNVSANLVLYKIAEDAKIEYNKEEGLDNRQIFQYLEDLAK